MPDYYLAASLVQLRAEINTAWPNRDKASDGWIGDPSHQARKSDHNPDWSTGGVVRAIDVDKDGIDVGELLRWVVRDHRVAYVIWNRRIASATEDGTPWDWEPYSGSNPHDKHVHISIRHTRAAETDVSRWSPGPTPVPPTGEEDDDMTPQDRALLTAIHEQTRGNAGLMVSLSNNLTALMKRELDDDADTQRDLEMLKTRAARVEELLIKHEAADQ